MMGYYMVRFVTAFLALVLPTLSAERPNIVFIFSDDHALQAISAYGGRFHKIATTPNIDRLAAEGMIFRNSFCGNSICGPSRASILTGKHSHINGFVDNESGRFDGGQQTFPKLLQKAGYETALIGKWHLVSEPTGFNYWEILPGQGSYVNPDFIQMDGSKKRFKGYVTDIVTDKTLDWLKNRRDKNKPFVLMAQHKAPHRNWVPAPRHYKLFEGIDMPEPESLFDDYANRIDAVKEQEMSIANHFFWGWDMFLHGKPTDKRFMGGLANQEYDRMTDAQKIDFDAAYGPENEKLLAALPTMKTDDLTRWKYQRYIKNYLSTIRAVDENIGRTLAYLEESGLAENTVVIYTSDQGFYLGEHGWYDKRWMFEDSLKMPFLVRWPGVAKAGLKPNAMIQNIDYAPTILEMAGAPIPADMQGNSIVPILRGEGKTPDDWRDAIFYQYSGENTHAVARHDGVRDSRHKLMRFPDTNEWMLFDLEKDPQEMNNILANPAYSDTLRKMQSLYAGLRKQYFINDSTFPMHRKKEVWWKQRWAAKNMENSEAKDIQVVFLGDSITQAWEDEGKSVWDKHFASLGALNWGYSGDRTEHLIWRLQNGEIQRVNPKAAVILIGTNNTGHNQSPAAETIAGIRQILGDLSWKWPDTNIIIMSVFPRGAAADDPLRKLNDEINAQLKNLADGKHIHLLDINANFMDSIGTLNKELFPDLLHLSPAAYEIWAEALAPKLKQIGVE